MVVMAGEWRVDAEGNQFQERREAEYFSVATVCFIYHQPLQIGAYALLHRSKQSESESKASCQPWLWLNGSSQYPEYETAEIKNVQDVVEATQAYLHV